MHQAIILPRGKAVSGKRYPSNGQEIYGDCHPEGRGPWMFNVGSDQESDLHESSNDPARELASMIMALGKGKDKGKPVKSNMQCYNCGHCGHLSKDCRQPKGGGKGVKGPGGKPQRLCCNCCKTGHIAKDCKVPQGSGRGLNALEDQCGLCPGGGKG